MPEDPKQPAQTQQQINLVIPDLTLDEASRIVGNLFLENYRLRALIDRLVTPAPTPIHAVLPAPEKTDDAAG